MWCIPKLNEEFRERMDNLLDLYAEDYDKKYPIICLDEKSKQMLKDSRPMYSVVPGKTACRDYEYVRKGTCNIFVAVEPKGGKRFVEVTDHRKKEDYAEFIRKLAEEAYSEATCLRIVQDNLNTHFQPSLIKAFGIRKTKQLMKRIQFNYTPKHASWLNMAEIEIGILDKQCLDRRIPTKTLIKEEVAAWATKRNNNKCRINWGFTREKAGKIFPQLYLTKLKG